MSTHTLQSLLRFLTQDAKVPLATALARTPALQKADLDTAEKLSKAKPDAVKSIFGDEKLGKQIISAAKRVSKKRAAATATGDNDDDDDTNNATTKTTKKRRTDGGRGTSLFGAAPLDPADLEASLTLPTSAAEAEDLTTTVLFTNRAPLVLAFLVTLLRFSMPEQPLSSRLSLAQGYVSVTSRSRAVYLGIESGRSAEEEGFGEGQPSVRVAGREIKVLRRWGYEWERTGEIAADGGEGGRAEGQGEEEVEVEEKPALWALDLEALKKSGSDKQPAAVNRTGTYSDLPIHTPQSARAYLLKAFDTAPDPDAPATKKVSAAAKAEEKERNLGRLLKALDLLYESWAEEMSPAELDGKTWDWYVKVRPAVADGAAGWGGKNQLRLADILALRR